MTLFNADGSRPAPRPRPAPRRAPPWLRLRTLVTFAALILAFAAIAVQLLRLGLRGGQPHLRMTVAEVVASG